MWRSQKSSQQVRKISSFRSPKCNKVQEKKQPLNESSRQGKPTGNNYLTLEGPVLPAALHTRDQGESNHNMKENSRAHGCISIFQSLIRKNKVSTYIAISANFILSGYFVFTDWEQDSNAFMHHCCFRSYCLDPTGECQNFLVFERKFVNRWSVPFIDTLVTNLKTTRLAEGVLMFWDCTER